MEAKYLILLFFLVISSTNSQFTSSDISYIKSFIDVGQNDKTGIFYDSIESTRRAIEVLLNLGEKIQKSSSICKEIQNESKNKVTLDLVVIDSLLKCKSDFSQTKIESKSFASLNSIEELYEKIKIADLLNKKISWEEAYNLLTGKYLSKNKFSFVPDGKKKTIYATALGLEMMSIIYKHADKTTKESIKNEAKSAITSLLLAYQELSDDVILFNEKNISVYKLNYVVLKSLNAINEVSPVNKLQIVSKKILNYFLTFKYEIFSLENINYISSVFQMHKDTPIISIKETNYDYKVDKSLEVKFVNPFGKEVKVANGTLSYEVKAEVEEKKQNKKSSYDLDDDEEEDSKNSKKTTKKEKEIKSLSKVSINVQDMITTPGKYKINLSLTIKPTKNVIKKTHIITSITKIKISNVKLSIENLGDKSLSEKETQIDYPKRTFRSMKANQDSVIHLKVKLNYGDNQVNKPGQIFLRLKHSELGKSFSAYVNDYNEREDSYSIDFAMDDPVNMESYNGNYELALVVSDASLDTPLAWSFGNIEITFRKPSDPNETISHKNKLKPKMEPTFTEQEQSLNKNYVCSIIFSGVIFATCFGLLLVLKASNVNVKNFPKAKSSQLYSLLFILLMFVFVYVLVLFWVKLNILQTLGLFTMMAIPGAITVYKAMKNIKIDI